MPVKSVFLHLTRLWLNGGRWGVLLAGFITISVWFGMAQWQQFQCLDWRSIDEMELRYLAMTAEAKKDLNLDFSHGVSEPLNNWLPHRTDGLVRPLWPWMAAWMMDTTDESGDAPGYPRGFALKVHLATLSFSLAVLMMLGLACARAFSVPAALLTVFLVGFGVFLPSGRFFLPDMLFSVLFLLTWVCCIAALKRNSLWLYGLIGFFSALANLTAPTTTPLVLVFVGVSTLRWLWGWIMQHFSPEGGTTLWVRRNHWLGLMLLFVCHLVTVGPMLSHAHQKLGEAAPFHWRWFENADELRAWTGRHHTLETLRVVPEDKRPTLANYRETHTTEEIQGRLKKGFETVVASVLACSWEPMCPRGWFAAAFASLLALLALMAWLVAPRAHHAGQALHPETAPIVLFTLLALGVCTLDFGWDTPVLDFGHRVLALYPPLVLSLLWACEAMVQRLRRRQMRLRVAFIYQVSLWLLCGMAAWWLIAFLQRASFTA